MHLFEAEEPRINSDKEEGGGYDETSRDNSDGHTIVILGVLEVWDDTVGRDMRWAIEIRLFSFRRKGGEEVGYVGHASQV